MFAGWAQRPPGSRESAAAARPPPSRVRRTARAPQDEGGAGSDPGPVPDMVSRGLSHRVDFPQSRNARRSRKHCARTAGGGAESPTGRGGRGAAGGGRSAPSLPAGPIGPRPKPRRAVVSRAFAAGRSRRAAHRVQRDLVRHVPAATFPPLPAPPQFAASPRPLRSAPTRLRSLPRFLARPQASGLDSVTARRRLMTTACGEGRVQKAAALRGSVPRPGPMTLPRGAGASGLCVAPRLRPPCARAGWRHRAVGARARRQCVWATPPPGR